MNYVIGNHTDTYQARGFSAFPRGFWDTDYYSPADSPDGTGTGVYPANTNFPTNIYIYNPNSSILTITYQTNSGTGTFTVPANSTRSMYEQAGIYVPQGSGIYLHGDNVFWEISNMDDGGPTHEWGYGLVPASLLGKEQFIGWAPSASRSPQGTMIMQASISPLPRTTPQCLSIRTMTELPTIPTPWTAIRANMCITR